MAPSCMRLLIRYEMRRRVIASGSRRNQTHYDRSCSRFVRRLQKEMARRMRL
jgi:hypothetical protein